MMYLCDEKINKICIYDIYGFKNIFKIYKEFVREHIGT